MDRTGRQFGLVVIALSVAGCSVDQLGRGPEVGAPCDLLSTTEVESALGVDLDDTPTEERFSVSIDDEEFLTGNCRWSLVSGAGDPAVALDLTENPEATADLFLALQDEGLLDSLPGLGDEAFFDPESGTVIARVGGTGIILDDRTTDGILLDPDQTRRALSGLMALVIERLGT